MLKKKHKRTVVFRLNFLNEASRFQDQISSISYASVQSPLYLSQGENYENYIFYKFLFFHANLDFLTRTPVGRLARPHPGANTPDHRILGHPEILVKRAPHFTVVLWNAEQEAGPSRSGSLKSTTSRRRSEASRRERIFALLSLLNSFPLRWDPSTGAICSLDLSNFWKYRFGWVLLILET